MVQRHLHTYRQVKSGSNQYKCQHPDCTHLSTRALIKGNRAICNGCTEEFILTSESLRRALPKCNSCIKSLVKTKKEDEITASAIDESAMENLVKDL